jgi:NitT/TauT family transport system substrate-binding protein
MFKRFLGGLIAAAAVLGSVSAQTPTPPEPQTLFLTFVPNIQFAPFYVAAEKGYFAEEGIAIAFEHGDEPLGVDLVAAGARDFAIISGEQVIAARANDRPVVFVYEWFQQYPIGVAVTAESGIRSVEDLAGARVGIPGRFGASYSGLLALLSANGMREGDIQLEEIGFNAPEVVCIGAIDAAVVYVNNEPLQIAERAAAGDCAASGVSVFPVAAAADMVSNGLITSEAAIAERPEQVAAMVRAVDRGLRDAIANPAEAYLLSLAHVETLPTAPEWEAALALLAEANQAPTDRTTAQEHRTRDRLALADQFADSAALAPALLQYDVLLSTIALWDADRLGETDPASWALTEDVLLESGALETRIVLEDAFTNAFLPPAG